MITLYFGLPRSGKTCYATALAINEQIKIFQGKSKYERVITNWFINFPGLIFSSYSFIKSHVCGRNSLIFIDEAQLDFSDRDYSNFSKKDVEFFTMHGHYKYDLVLLTQQWDGVDRKIRVLINDIFYVRKGHFGYSHVYPVKYSLIIPRRRENFSQNPNVGKILQGYERWSLTEGITHKRFYRPVYYKYYSSFEDPQGALAPWLPKDYLITHPFKKNRFL